MSVPITPKLQEILDVCKDCFLAEEIARSNAEAAELAYVKAEEDVREASNLRLIAREASSEAKRTLYKYIRGEIDGQLAPSHGTS